MRTTNFHIGVQEHMQDINKNRHSTVLKIAALILTHTSKIIVMTCYHTKFILFDLNCLLFHCKAFWMINLSLPHPPHYLWSWQLADIPMEVSCYRKSVKVGFLFYTLAQVYQKAFEELLKSSVCIFQNYLHIYFLLFQ